MTPLMQYLEDTSQECDGLVVRIAGHKMIIRGPHFDEKYPGLLLGTDPDGEEVMLVVDKIEGSTTFTVITG